VVRASPPCAPLLAGVEASGELLAPPRAARGLLVVVGSYVPNTTAQLAAVTAEYPHALVVVDVAALASRAPAQEVARAAREAATRIAADGLAVVVTPRERPRALRSLAAAERSRAVSIMWIASRFLSRYLNRPSMSWTTVFPIQSLGCHAIAPPRWCLDRASRGESRRDQP